MQVNYQPEVRENNMSEKILGTFKYNDGEYLTVTKLASHLSKIFTGQEFILDKQYQGCRYRPDILIRGENILFEYDGFLHYTLSAHAITDIRRDKFFSDLGLQTIRIPYFIQWSRDTVRLLLDKDIDIVQVYPHGFNDKKAVLPADFSYAGTDRFLSDLKKFDFAYDQIRESLLEKISIKDKIQVTNCKVDSFFGFITKALPK